MNGYPIADMAASSLAGLARSLPAPTELEGAELVLEVAGDALRCGVALPSEVARWLRSVSAETLSQAAEHGAASLDETPRPPSGHHHELLEAAVLTRDRTESLLVGIRRACVAAGRAPGAVATALLNAQTRFDDDLAGRITRREAEAALGVRRGLLEGLSWTRAFEEPEEATDGDIADDGPSVPLTAQPSSQAVVDYVTDGYGARWVEGAAARDPEFAEQLRATIETFAAMGEQTSFMARLWMRRSPVRYGLDLDKAAADGDEDASAEPARVQLGQLAPTGAGARLTVEGGRITLRVVADEGTLREVRFADRDVPSVASGAWSIDIAWTTEPLTLVVVDREGRRFEGQIALDPGPDAP